MQWIKVFTEYLQTKNQKYYSKNVMGTHFFRVWIQLLTIAGQCNARRKVNDFRNNPMTVHELATIIHKRTQKWKIY